MNGPTVKPMKGMVNRRHKSRPVSRERMDALVQEFVEGPSLERRNLVAQWSVLKAAGVPVGVICEEFGVSRDTFQCAIRDPEKWCRAVSECNKGSTFSRVQAEGSARATRQRRGVKVR